jgi:hypothetical protein
VSIDRLAHRRVRSDQDFAPIASALWERWIDINALLTDLERSGAIRLRAWALLGELRAILAAAGQELEKSAHKSFVESRLMIYPPSFTQNPPERSL